MSFRKIWKKLLVIWIALGIAISGYFYSFPDHKLKYDYQFCRNQAIEMENDYSKAKLFLVITIVGSVLIGGFGKLTINKDN